MTGAPVIKKVPGNLVKFNHEKDGYVLLEKLSKTELLDLIQRENKLLNNKKFLSKLPDKGQRIKSFAERAALELKKRDEHEKLCGLLASLNVNDAKEAIEKLEWTGKYIPQKKSEADEKKETNTFQILVSHSGASASKEKQIEIEETVTLIKPSDLSEDEKTDLNEVDVYAKLLCNRFDSAKPDEKRKPFYAHKSLNTVSVKDLVKDKEPKAFVSSSPGITANKAKMLSLHESIIIQQQQTKNLKEIELRHALEKLANKTSIRIGNPEANVSHYRDVGNHDSDDSDDEKCWAVTNEESEVENEKNTATFYNLVD